MNFIWKFTINPDSTKSLSNDENQFIDELAISKDIWYEFPHYYSGDAITWYRAAIIEVEVVDIDYIKNIYWIEPNKIYKNIKSHLVFYFKKSLNKFDYSRVTKALAFLYEGKSIDYHFYPENWVTTEYSSDKVNDNLVNICTRIYFFKDQDSDYQKNFSISDYEKYIECNKIQIIDILKELYKKDNITLNNLKVWIDEKRNIHKDFWYPFEVVTKYYWSVEKAQNFFREKFEIWFEEINSFDYTKSREWTVITSWENLFINDYGYFTLDDKWNRKKITDFYVKVHSKIVWIDWKHNFIVTLVNEKEWVETKKIIRENKTSITPFSDFIQSYWPYHYSWSAQLIKELHKQISTTKQVPEVKQVIWYWHHAEYDIIIFRNWVWDMKQKLFTLKNIADDDFYYNYDNSWYWVTDKQRNPLSTILTEWVPYLNIDKVLQFDDILDYMNTLYADNSWAYLLFLAFWMMGHLLYWDKNNEFPLIFTRWTTWSGKTKYNEILQRMWGVDRAWNDFENSTMFSMTVWLSYMIKFPYFIVEYREAASQRWVKVWLLKSVFDKKSQGKWRADQSLVVYNYVAMPVLDWEEMIMDWALRTRSLQYQLLKKHKISWNFWKLLRDWYSILDNVLFTYMTKSKWEKYQDYIDEWYGIFKQMTTDDRIAKNIMSIYAWCMCFDPENKDSYITVLEEVLKFQNEDVKQNSTSMQIVKALSKFMENSYNSVFIRKNDIIISWNALEEYMSRYKIETTLKISSYKEHLQQMWFDIDFVEAWEQLVEWVIVPFSIIPKNLLTDARVYQSYKDWLKLNPKK